VIVVIYVILALLNGSKKMSERDEQKKVIDYCKMIGLFVYAIPAVVFGKSRYTKQPIGYVKGMPDLCIPKLNLYIEMKDIKAGKVKEHEQKQSEIHEKLKLQGQNVFRCEGFEQAKKVIDWLLT
jgi:hypothetical protein